MDPIASTQSTILDTPPSCIEVCPWDTSIVAIGTYLLHNSSENAEELSGQPQIRTGTLEIYRIASDQNSIHHFYSQPCDYAILDLHFHPLSHGDCSSIWTANSTGSLTRHELAPFHEDTSRTNGITKSWIYDLRDHYILALSFTFHPKDPDVLGVTFSDGSVVLYKISLLSDTGDASVEASASKVFKHDLEAWTMSFDFHSNRLFSGGDDAVLQCSIVGMKETLGSDAEHKVQASLVWKNRKIHGAGVVAILPLDERLILTGSYDDHVRVLNIERAPKMLEEQNLEGGVWRLKLMNSHKDKTVAYYDVLASCMHAGVRIVRITVPENGVPRIEILAKFEEHASMNYGSDFVVSKNDRHEYTILSTSFYDKKLCLRKYRTPAFAIATS